jgi:putative transposase
MSTLRKTPLVTSEIYHIYNRGLDKRPTFTDFNENLRAYQAIKFYRFESPPVRLSYFVRYGTKKIEELTESSWGNQLVSIIAYCLMPNHFHFILRQEVDGGISKFISNFENSYTRYFNTKSKRVGGLFLDDFQNVLVDSEEQLLHLTRYVHLNPYSSSIIKTLDELLKYEWSSLKEYIGGGEEPICNKEMVMSYFKNKESYKTFVFDRADYQRELKRIEHLFERE